MPTELFSSNLVTEHDEQGLRNTDFMQSVNV
jgi:hypothetical protein